MVTMQLVVNRIVTLQLQKNEQLQCREGVLWVSHAGEDVILQPGECLKIQKSGLAVVEAIAAATLVRSGATVQANALVGGFAARPEAA